MLGTDTPDESLTYIDTMVTITDVAREAGVSKTTVSYVISGNPRISQTTADHVRRTMERLGYTVNHTARALSTSKTMTLAVLTGWRDDYPLDLAKGVYLCLLSNCAREQGYDLLLISNADGVHALKTLAAEKKVDGIILMDVAYDDPRIPVAAQCGVPVMCFGMPHDPQGLDAMDSDFEAAARELIQHFAERGHRELVLVRAQDAASEREELSCIVRFRQSALAAAHDCGICLHVSAERGECREAAS